MLALFYCPAVPCGAAQRATVGTLEQVTAVVAACLFNAALDKQKPAQLPQHAVCTAPLSPLVCCTTMICCAMVLEHIYVAKGMQ